MHCKRILKLDKDLEKQVLELLLMVDEPSMNHRALISECFKGKEEQVGLFGLFEGDRLLGFAYAEKPNNIFPGRGYLQIVAAEPNIPLHTSREGFNKISQWLIENGATYLWGWTRLNPKVIKRIYGFEIASELQVFCPLVGDDYKKVERIPL